VRAIGPDQLANSWPRGDAFGLSFSAATESVCAEIHSELGWDIKGAAIDQWDGNWGGRWTRRFFSNQRSPSLRIWQTVEITNLGGHPLQSKGRGSMGLHQSGLEVLGQQQITGKCRAQLMLKPATCSCAANQSGHSRQTAVVGGRRGSGAAGSRPRAMRPFAVWSAHGQRRSSAALAAEAEYSQARAPHHRERGAKGQRLQRARKAPPCGGARAEGERWGWLARSLGRTVEEPQPGGVLNPRPAQTASRPLQPVVLAAHLWVISSTCSRLDRILVRRRHMAFASGAPLPAGGSQGQEGIGRGDLLP